MHIAFSLAQHELKQARHMLYHRLRSRAERLTDYSFVAIAVALLIASLPLLYRNHLRHWGDFPWASIAFLLLAVQSWRRHHQFADQPDYSEQQTLEIGEDSIFRVTRSGERIKLPWSKVSQYTESADMFILLSPWPWGAEAKPKVLWRNAWLTKPVLVVLPKRAFEPGNTQQFRELLDRKLSVWAKGRSIGAVPQHS
jgi:YcxB-like protein